MLLPGAALAAPPQWPDAADMARTLENHPFPGPARLATEPPRTPPIPHASDTPSGPLDLEAFARHGAALPAAEAIKPSAPALQIFITLDMPQASLQRLVDQAARAGGTLVLRGLKAQSLRATLATVQPLLESRRVAWVIDPQAFERFHVTVAPTFVLTTTTVPAGNAQTPCANAAITSSDFVSIVGDVSLDYALDALAKRRPALAPDVTPLLERLRGS